MNQCHFEGRITADPELRNISNEKRVTNFRIAVDRRYKRGKETAKETAFLDMEAWDTGADIIAKHFAKGDPIIVHCSVKQEEWDDKATGARRSKLKFRVNSFDFPLGKTSGKKTNPNAAPQDDEPQGGGDAGGGGGDDDEQIPF